MTVNCPITPAVGALAGAILLTLFPLDAAAQGPERPAPLLQHAASPSAEVIPSFNSAGLQADALSAAMNGAMPPIERPSFERVLLGTTLGAVAGAAVGAGVALLVYASEDTEGATLGPLPHLLVYGTPITAAGIAVGTYIGSRGRANPWLTVAASAAGAGLGVGLGLLIGDTVGAGSAEVVGITSGAVIGISIPALVGWATAR